MAEPDQADPVYGLQVNHSRMELADHARAGVYNSRDGAMELPVIRNVVLNLPTFGFIVSTRAALGLGIGLLLSERLPVQRRRAIGATLIAIGAATTVPALRSVIRSVRRSNQREMSSSVERDERLIGVTRFPRKGDDIA